MKTYNNEKPVQETELCFFLTLAMLNFLIFGVMSTIGWLFYWLVTRSNLIEVSIHNFSRY
jgi:hypothetical protein